MEESINTETHQKCEQAAAIASSATGINTDELYQVCIDYPGAATQTVQQLVNYIFITKLKEALPKDK